jgi:hypothetical protein
MPQGVTKANRWVGPDQIKSIVVSYDDAVSQTVPALKMPVNGYVISATLFASESSSGTNVIQAGLKNGGPTGAGTAIVAALTNGTVLAGSAYALTIASNGPEVFSAGDLLMLQVVTTMVKTNIDVQVDYALDPN